MHFILPTCPFYHHRFSIIQASLANVSRILIPDFFFDREAYRAYSKVYLPITYVLSYAVQFAMSSSFGHSYRLLAWPGHMAAIEEILRERQEQRQSKIL